jgi:hypothetical protein
MVKRGTEIVNSIADHQRAFSFSVRVDCNGDECPIMAEIYSRGLRVSVQDDWQVSDVLFGPINL